jgi:hypothetical protein
VKRLLAGLVGGFGLGALFRRRRRRASQAGLSPAEELRTKLAAAEARVESVEQEPAREETAPDEPVPADELEARRRDVHERARQSLDELA